MTSSALAVQNGNLSVVEPFIDREKQALLADTILKGATTNELALFVNLCTAKRLDPFTRQIYGIKTNQGLQMFASIDGLRVIAQRSGQYGGQVGPFWCGKDGQWTDVWLAGESPSAAKVGVLRKGWTEPMWGVATLKSYGKDSPIWKKMADTMLAKCAESVALRKAFPDDISGLYIREEFGEAETPEPTHHAPTAPQSRHSTPPVMAEVVVDQETGEITGFNPDTASQKQILDKVTRLRGELGWTETDLADFAAANRISGRSRAGNLKMIEALQEMLDHEYADDEDEAPPAQGTLLDAETRDISGRDWTD